jgi:enoyl-CoA hydratase/carnithine racemase
MAREAPLVLSERRPPLAVLRLNRPEHGNALSLALADALRAALAEARRAPGVKAIILTGAGRTFSIGGDLRERRGVEPREIIAQRTERLFPLMRELWETPQPVIAALNGPALAGGAGLALHCDFRIAATTARFGLTEILTQRIAAAGHLQILAHMIGLAAAKELAMTGRILDAREALRRGIYTAVVPPPAVGRAALRFARGLLANSQAALTGTKRLVNAAADLYLPWALAVATSDAVLFAPETQRGIREFDAFLRRETRGGRTRRSR